MGIDVQSLYEYNHDSYVYARNQFIAAAAGRISALTAHANSLTQSQRNATSKCIDHLSEMEYKSSSLARQHSNFLQSLHLYQRIMLLSDMDPDDQLLARLIPLWPDLNSRKTLDFKTLRLLHLKDVVDKQFAGNKDNVEDVLPFIENNRAEINYYTKEGEAALSWSEFVSQMQVAVVEKTMQNFFDYIAVLYRLGLHVANAENEVYIAGLQVAYFLDLYMHIKSINLGNIKGDLENILKEKIKDTLDLLRSAPDPSNCLEKKPARTKYLPSFPTSSRRKTRTEREIKITKEYPNKYTRSTVCRLSIW